MFLFPFFYACLTNNSELAACVSGAEFVQGPAISVLTGARDMIHGGWKLVANPLYGNFKPSQQPYRTIVLSSENKDTHCQVDSYSLRLIETAIRVYTECEKRRIPGEMPDQIERDYKYIDFELIKGTLQECGILKGDIQRCIRG